MEKKFRSSENEKIEVSIVIPLFNEIKSCEELYRKLKDAMDPLVMKYEIIFIDDGSTDNSFEVLSKIFFEDVCVKVIKLRKNFGKAQALSAGFKESRGEIIVTLDADLQDVPSEIPNFLKKIEEGYDLVSGWKVDRKDSLTKTIPSKIFNKVTAFITGVKLHDFNCGFKAYRKEVVNNLELYGELHRYIPVLASRWGFEVGEIPVKHQPRLYGKSKYGFERYVRGFLDLLTVVLLTKYRGKPLHFFGLIGLIISLAGFVINFVLISRHFLFLIYGVQVWELRDRPLLSLGVLLVIVGIQFISIGLLAEMINVSKHHTVDMEGSKMVEKVLKKD